jgi:hypothetical protein
MVRVTTQQKFEPEQEAFTAHVSRKEPPQQRTEKDQKIQNRRKKGA